MVRSCLDRRGKQVLNTHAILLLLADRLGEHPVADAQQPSGQVHHHAPVVDPPPTGILEGPDVLPPVLVVLDLASDGNKVHKGQKGSQQVENHECLEEPVCGGCGSGQTPAHVHTDHHTGDQRQHLVADMSESGVLFAHLCHSAAVVNELPEPWTLGNSAKLIDIDERQVTISKGDISCDITEGMIRNGAELSYVELEYDGIVTCKVEPTLEIKSLKYSKDLLSDCENDVGGSTILKINEIVKMFKSLVGDFN